MNINTNISALKTRNFMRMTSNNLENAMERLSSGKRINSAGDDAAGLAIVSRMESIVRGLGAANRNSQDGISLLQTAESSLSSISNILQRVRELAVQADNGTYNTNDKTSLQSEIEQLTEEIDHISSVSEFNGVGLLNGASATLDLHISHLFDDTMTLTLYDARITGGGITVMSDLGSINVSTDAQGAISAVDDALDLIATWRADYGALLNRLNFTIDNLAMTSQNTISAKSRIEDADMAEEVSRMTKERVLTQSGVSMLTQANQAPQMILQLLQG